MEANNINIYQKLATIQTQIAGAKKSETNAFLKMKYITKKQLVQLIKPFLQEHNLALTYETKHQFITELKKIEINYTFILSDGNESIKFHDFIFMDIEAKQITIEQLRGRSDTYLWKYALANIFMIPILDQNDPDTQQSYEKAVVPKLKEQEQTNEEPKQKLKELLIGIIKNNQTAGKAICEKYKIKPSLKELNNLLNKVDLLEFQINLKKIMDQNNA